MRSQENKRNRKKLATALFPMVVLITSIGVISQQGIIVNIQNAFATDKILYDDFSGATYALADGATSPNGRWLDNYNGYGTAGIKVEPVTGQHVFFEQPKTATKPNQGYGTKVISTATFGNFALSVDVRTDKQLRTSHQKSSDTAWLMFRHADKSDYYYFMLKTVGYELGKKINNKFYYLERGNTPTAKIGHWQHVDISVIANKISIAVDGIKIIDYTDYQMSSAMKIGAIGLYASNAAASFDNVYATPIVGTSTSSTTTTPSVVDTTPPSIIAPSDKTVEATGLTTNIGLGTPIVSDAIDPSPTVTNNAPSSGFPLGSTIVTWKATDDAGNTATDTQIVTVKDTAAPSLSIAAPASGSYVTSDTLLVQGTASDYLSSGINKVSVSLDLGTYIKAIPKAPGDWSTWSVSISISTAGSHSITAVATDNAGNTNSKSISISKGSTTTGSGTTSSNVYDDFEGTSYCITKDGATSPDGKWRSGYVAYGSACIQADTSSSTNGVLVTAPKLDSTLRAIRIDSTDTWNNIHAKMTVRLDKQNTYNTQSWYTIWPLIGYVDETNHYYFNLKTNGWELGKKDNNLDPSLELQRYLALGSSPKASIGQKAVIEYWIILGKSPANGVTSNHIIVNVNGVKVVDMWDDGTHSDDMGKINATGDKLKGPKHISLYNEASQVSWDNIIIEEAQ